MQSALAAVAILAGAAGPVSRDGLDARIERALELAGANRPAIEAFLSRYESSSDREKRDASRWLVANMEGHGFARIALLAPDGTEIAFEALDHPDLASAKARLDALERAHPGAEFRRARFDSDLEHATSDFLSTHLDEAFDAWRTLPWGRSIRYEAFREHVLPYRGSNEPLGLWRRAARERLKDLCEANAVETDVRAIGEKVRATVHPWCGFSDLFYLHPTDQGYEEMTARKQGRCEDITNMVSFGMRSVALMCASDYTPWWAASDNNHAWEVVLDAEGNGRAGLAGRAAKVYRKTFAHQPESLGAIRRDDETVPRWLSGTHYVDVTSQYQPTTDLRLAIEGARKDDRFAYLAVFNGGAWRPIEWGRIEAEADARPHQDGRPRSASFRAMGRNVCYLPMLCRDGADVPAGAPFVIDLDGNVHPLEATAPRVASLEAGITKPDRTDPDTGVLRARTVVRPDAAYELFVWKDGGWSAVGRVERGSGGASFENLAPDGLYWLVEDGSERLERIFTIEAGRQVFW